MTSVQFVFWLQGFFELGDTSAGLTAKQTECIKKHLALVFIHEIDPSAGDAAHQANLNETHAPPKPAHTPVGIPGQVKPLGGPGPDGTVYRC